MTLDCHRFFPENFTKYYTAATQSAFTCSKLIMETPEQCVKPVQSEQYRHRNDVHGRFEQAYACWVFCRTFASKGFCNIHFYFFKCLLLEFLKFIVIITSASSRINLVNLKTKVKLYL